MNSKSHKIKNTICTCAVLSCTNSTTNSNLTFFRFPENNERFALWANAIDRDELLLQRYHDIIYQICSKHFDESMFKDSLKKRLSTNAFPVYHLEANSPDKLKISRIKSKVTQALKRSSEPDGPDIPFVSAGVTLTPDSVSLPPPPLPLPLPFSTNTHLSLVSVPCAPTVPSRPRRPVYGRCLRSSFIGRRRLAPAPAPTSQLQLAPVSQLQPAPIPQLQPAPISQLQPAPIPQLPPDPVPQLNLAPTSRLQPASTPQLHPASTPQLHPAPTSQPHPAFTTQPPSPSAPSSSLIAPAPIAAPSPPFICQLLEMPTPVNDALVENDSLVVITHQDKSCQTLTSLFEDKKTAKPPSNLGRLRRENDQLNRELNYVYTLCEQYLSADIVRFIKFESKRLSSMDEVT